MYCSISEQMCLSTTVKPEPAGFTPQFYPAETNNSTETPTFLKNSVEGVKCVDWPEYCGRWGLARASWEIEIIK